MQKALPIDKYESEIIHRVENNRVVVVSGNTGCGKSTQIPRFLYNYHKGDCKIICTQPRRVACINIATRVAQLLNTQVGSLVGYHIGLEARQSKDTKLLWWSTSLNVCDTHRPKLLKEVERLVGQELWDTLPSIFGLPGWSSTRNVNDEVSD